MENLPVRVLSNYKPQESSEKLGYKTLDQIREDLRAITGGWPRKISGALFVIEEGGADARLGFSYLTKPEEFKAWLMRVVKLRWTSAGVESEDSVVQPISVESLFHDLRMRPFHSYRAVEQMPQFPERDGVYYLGKRVGGGEGHALEEFIGMMNAASDEDRDLLKAMLLTMFTGIGPGERPSFVLTSEHGKGAGKTATAEAIVSVAGGAIQPDPNEPVNRLMESFFTVESMGKRCVLVDNVKGVLGMSTIERLITSRQVEGHWLRQGRVSRENLLTWVFTGNMPKLSTDLSQRSVIIKIGPRKNGFDFNGWVEEFLRERRDELVGDCLEMLEKGDRGAVIHVANQGRFGAWERAVLRLFPNADKLALLIRRRKGEVDADADQAETLMDEIRKCLKAVNLDPDENPERNPVVIQWKDVARMIERAWKETAVSSKSAGSLVRQMMGYGPMQHIRENRCKTYGSGIVVGPVNRVDEPVGRLVKYERPTMRSRHGAQ